MSSAGQDACLLGGHLPGQRSRGELVCSVGSMSLQEWGRVGVSEIPQSLTVKRVTEVWSRENAAPATGVPGSLCPAVASVEILLHFQGVGWRGGGFPEGKGNDDL